jgi:hypothetical protein
MCTLHKFDQADKMKKNIVDGSCGIFEDIVNDTEF